MATSSKRLKDLVGSTPPPKNTGVVRRLNDPAVKRQREMFGGALTGPAQTPILLYLSNLDQARRIADGGKLVEAARLYDACKVDGVIQGLLSTRTSGLTRLPLRWSGDSDACSALQAGVIGGAANDDPTSLFYYACPRQELSRFAEDGVGLGVAIGSLEIPEGSALPMFQRLDPAGLRYEWSTNAWWYDTMSGPILIEPGINVAPGGSRFVFYCAGRQAPWTRGIWAALVRSFIIKDHARNYKSTFESKLANPALKAESPLGASEDDAEAWFEDVSGWGVNTVLAGPPGYTVDIVQSNGIGAAAFDKTIEDQDRESTILISGQTVLTDGGSGFQNGAIFKSIRSDLIQSDAAWLSEILNFQILPMLVEALFPGEGRVVTVHYDALPPQELTQQATAYVSVAAAISNLTAAFIAAGQGQQLDVDAICKQNNIPLLRMPDVFADIEAIAELVPETKVKQLPASTEPAPDEGKMIEKPSKVDDVASLPTAPEAAPAAEATPTTDVQKLSLNGAQVSSMLEIINSCATGQIPRNTALQILKAAFQMDDKTADDLLGEVGQGFKPAVAEPATAPAAFP